MNMQLSDDFAANLVARQHFFFQAEDGIRDLIVTGVQTCALPIYRRGNTEARAGRPDPPRGRASAEHLRGPVSLPHGARGRLRRQGRPVELLQLLRRYTGLLPAGSGSLPQSDRSGRAGRRAALPGGRASDRAERRAAGETGAGGEAGGEPMRPVARRVDGWTGSRLGSWPGLVGIGCAVLLPVYPSTRLAAQVDRTKPPVLPPSPALQLPAVQPATLPNGLQLAVVGTPKGPVVDVQV